MTEIRKAVRLTAATPGARPVPPAPAVGDKAPAAEARGPGGKSSGPGIVAVGLPEALCPKCGKRIPMGAAVPLSDATCPGCGATFMAPGRLDSFVLLERIGAGEMGEIYRARDEALYREVAIKVVHADRADEGSLHERLSQEARAAARLSHPRVAQVHALGFSNGHPYLVMELVHGEDMDVKVKREGRIEERVVLRVADEVSQGLQALHREGLTHGDIKPGNIIVDGEGSSKLVDFGLSGMSRRDGNRAILGTPQYIAPESLRGAPDSSQTDLYSLGATLYHLLAGAPPFDGPNPVEVAKARLLKPADPAPLRARQLSAGTQRMVMRLLEADPARRYRDCTELLKDIHEIRKHLDAPVVPPPGAQAPATPMRSALSNAVRHEKPAVPERQPPPPRVPPRPPPRPAPRRFPGPMAVVAALAGVVLLGGVAAFFGLRATGVRDGSAPAPEAAEAAPEGGAPDAGSVQIGGAGEVSVGGSAAAGAVGGGAAAPSPKAFTRVLAPRWETVGMGQSGRGSTVWHRGKLILQGEGVEMPEGTERCRFFHARVEGDFELSAKVVIAATANELARVGLLVRENTDAFGPSLFFGRMGDGSLLLRIRQADGMERDVGMSRSFVPLPCYLQLARRGNGFDAATSEDGVRWQPFGQCDFVLPSAALAGVAVDSGATGARATAEAHDLVLKGPDPAATP